MIFFTRIEVVFKYGHSFHCENMIRLWSFIGRSVQSTRKHYTVKFVLYM